MKGLVIKSTGTSYGVYFEDGTTVLWRRFNKNDWALHRFCKPWTELLPENERLLINGETFVHWYDCVSDYIF